MNNGISIEDLNLAKQSDIAFKFQVISPKTDKPLPGVFFSVIGDHSDAVKEFTRKALNNWRQQAAIKTRKGKDDEARLIEEDEEFSIEACVVRVVSWEGITEPCTDENKRKLFKMNAELRAQVLRNSGTIGNFTKL